MPFGDGCNMQAECGVAESAANYEGIVAGTIFQTRIEQKAALVAVAGPKQLHAILHRFCAEALAEMHPVILRGVAHNLQPAHITGRFY